MKFLHITIEHDELRIDHLRKAVGEDFGRFFIKGTPIYNKYTGQESAKIQKTNRWVFSAETKSNNINIGLKTFLKRLLTKKELRPYLETFGSIVEIVVYNEDERSRHQISISQENMSLLAELHASLQVAMVDF